MGVTLKRFFSLRSLLTVLPLAIFAVAFFFLGDFIGDYDFEQIWAHVETIPQSRLWWAAGLTVFSYLLMSMYDVLGFIYVRHSIKKTKVIPTALIAYALNNSTGFGGVVGGAFRFRSYMSYGVKAFDVFKIVSFIVVGFWLGTLAVNGVSFLVYPFQFSSIPSWMFRLLGALFLVLVGVFLMASYYRKQPLQWRGKALELPPFKLSVSLLLLATVDWFLGASVLYMLLPEKAQIFFPIFVAIFSTSTILALLTNMPGGLGVLETMILIFVGSSGATPSQIFGSLMVYRFIFNFCPFILGLGSAGVLELQRTLRGRKKKSLAAAASSSTQSA